LSDGDDAEMHAHAERVASTLRDGMNAEVDPDPAELFAHVYATQTPQLREQAALVADELAAAELNDVELNREN
jgi:pyruvate dehydrogenase E1 component alpha subunit